jgi:hypothetical protein
MKAHQPNLMGFFCGYFFNLFLNNRTNTMSDKKRIERGFYGLSGLARVCIERI